MELKLNIYDEQGKEIVRVAEGEYHELLLGVVIDIFELFGVEKEVPTIWEMSLKTVTCYKQVKEILKQQFPDITPQEWRRVKLSELLRVCSGIIKYSVKELDIIPTEKK